MTRSIKIEGDLVSIINTEVEQVVSLADYLPLIEKRSPVSAPVLPTGTRAVWWDPTNLARQRLVLLMERDPHVAHISYEGRMHEVQLPYTRFIFLAKTTRPEDNLSWHLEDYRVFWSDRRYSKPTNSDMIPAVLPNVYPDGRICFGSTAPDADQSIADRLDSTVNGFFLSDFNHDLGLHFPNNFRTWSAWQTMTRRNPTGWTQWEDWRNPSRGIRTSLYEILEQITSERLSRDEPVITPDPIPPLELGATFGRFTEWLDSLSTHDRAIAWAAMSQAQAENPEAFTADETTPEPEEEV